MKKLNKFFAILLTLLCSGIFVLVMGFAQNSTTNVTPASGQISQTILVRDENGDYVMDEDNRPVMENIVTVIGEDICAVRISDLGELGCITQVNYIPDVFAQPMDFDNAQIVDLTEDFSFAKSGTLFFVILNLDPYSEDFTQQSENLEQYKRGDYWKFTLQIPQVFGASNVYLDSQLVASHGEISGYKFINYNTSYDKVSEKYLPTMSKTQLDMQFYTRRESMDSIYTHRFVTIHYQSDSEVHAGITDFALVGTKDCIDALNRQNETWTLCAILLSIVVFAILLVLSILKKSANLVGEIVSIFAIVLWLLTSYLMITSTTTPLLLQALRGLSVFLLLGGGIYFVGKHTPYKKILLVLCIICGVCGVLATILPYISIAVANVLNVILLLFRCAIALVIVACAIVLSLKDKPQLKWLSLVCAGLLCAFCLSNLITNPSGIVATDRAFWLAVALSLFAFATTFKIFFDTEQSNSYLTHNLHLEVQRQVQDANSIIAERDKLLQFVSHDMKKPLSASIVLLTQLQSREKDNEQIKMINIIKQNTQKVVENLTEISSFAKFNYIAEASTAINLKELCALIHKYCVADCEAAGINLINLVDKEQRAFAKAQGLENAVTNIIFNAIEHANCTKVELSIERVKNKVLLKITDDGKGVDKNIDVFSPYIGETNSDGAGLGLYLCKAIIESMNGTLTYTSEPGKTVFIISLLRA